VEWVSLCDANGQPIAAVAVTGPLTDAQLRAAAVPVSDGAGSLTVDAPVGTPLFARLSDGIGNLIGQRTMAGSLPVVLASDHSVVKAREDTGAMTWVSARAAAPGIGAVQADTGALAAGDYDFDIELMVSEPAAAGHSLVVEHRNAANAATLFNLGGCPAPGAVQLRIRRYTLALNERIRVIAGTVAGIAASDYVSAIGRRVA
jgi:hypothetical protein